MANIYIGPQMPKTEALWCETDHNISYSRGCLMSAGVPVAPGKSVRYLGVYVDADLCLCGHTYKERFRGGLLLSDNSVRSVPSTTLQTLVVTLVLSRLDLATACAIRRTSKTFQLWLPITLTHVNGF